MFGAVIVRDLVEGVPVIARVNHASNLDNIYRAGADYALSIADISGEILTARLLGRAARTRDEQRQIIPMNPEMTAGRSISELPVRATGCSIVAIRRSGAVITRIDPKMKVEADDELYVCGNSQELRELSL
jgi:Trk K+ transport system NAD-binding subunit